MIRLWTRRVASILAFVLFCGALVTWSSYYFYPLLVASIVVQFLVQRSTEIGWRVFKSDLDERQEALKARILELSYRWLIGLVVFGLVVTSLPEPLVPMFDPFPFGFLFDFGPSGPPGTFGIRGFASMSPLFDLFVILLVVIFFLPGVVAAWIEPVPRREQGQATADA